MMDEALGTGDEQEADGAEPPLAAEYSFLREGETPRHGDTQTLAPATEDQATEAEIPDPEAATEADEPTAQEPEDEAMAEAEEQRLPEQTFRSVPQAKAGQIQIGDSDVDHTDAEKAPDKEEAEPQNVEAEGAKQAETDSYVAALLQKQARLDDNSYEDGRHNCNCLLLFSKPRESFLVLFSALLAKT